MSFSADDILEKIDEWRKDNEWEIGFIPFAMLENAYLDSVAGRGPATFDELLAYTNKGLDIVSRT